MNIIELGRYKQIGEEAQPTPIQWIVLKKEGSKALLLSRYILDYRLYQNDAFDGRDFYRLYKYSVVTWKTCSLRKWLNEDFLLQAFDQKERSMIVPTLLQTQSNENFLWLTDHFLEALKIENDWSNPDRYTATWNYNRTFSSQIKEAKENPVFTETEDYVFLLSEEERDAFFHPQYLKTGVPTYCAYLKKASLSRDGFQDGFIHNKETTKIELGKEWVRGKFSPYPDTVGTCVEKDYLAVRPAIWIDLTAWGAENGVGVADITPVKDPEDMKRIIAQSWTESSGYPEVTMGRYKYDKKGKQYRPIKWLVLDETDGKTLLLSKNVLAHVKYDSADCEDRYDHLGIPAWEDSEMRRWLNEEFINEAFDEDEKNAIVETQIDPLPPDKYSNKTAWVFKPTKDKLFLLTREEAKHYFARGLTMEAYGTPFATYKWVRRDPPRVTMSWACREKALEATAALQFLNLYVFHKSEADYDPQIYLGDYPTHGTEGLGVGVRPAMWVNSSAIKQ